MNEWFWAGLWGGIWYAMIGLIVMGLIVGGLILYAAVRIVLDRLHIKEWKL
jgi:hypothetical protein